MIRRIETEWNDKTIRSENRVQKDAEERTNGKYVSKYIFSDQRNGHGVNISSIRDIPCQQITQNPKGNSKIKN